MPHHLVLDRLYVHAPLHGDDAASGNDTLARYFPGANVRRNVIAGADRCAYPPDNFYPATLDAVGFVNRASGDYRLARASRYRQAGTDGKDVGVDMRRLLR